MKSNQTESPSAESSNQRNPCYETTHKHSFALGVTADDGHEYFLSTSQFLEAELTANVALERNESAQPERLQIRYATGEVMVLGRGLRRLGRMLQDGDLISIKPLGSRYSGLEEGRVMISSIVVTRKEVV